MLVCMLGGGIVYWLGAEASPIGADCGNIIFIKKDYENYVDYLHKIDTIVLLFSRTISSNYDF